LVCLTFVILLCFPLFLCPSVACGKVLRPSTYPLNQHLYWRVWEQRTAQRFNSGSQPPKQNKNLPGGTEAVSAQRKLSKVYFALTFFYRGNNKLNLSPGYSTKVWQRKGRESQEKKELRTQSAKWDNLIDWWTLLKCLSS